jgi:hypothetical protein
MERVLDELAHVTQRAPAVISCVIGDRFLSSATDEPRVCARGSRAGMKTRCAVKRDSCKTDDRLLSSALGTVQNFFSMVLPGSAGDHE